MEFLDEPIRESWLATLRSVSAEVNHRTDHSTNRHEVEAKYSRTGLETPIQFWKCAAGPAAVQHPDEPDYVINYLFAFDNPESWLSHHISSAEGHRGLSQILTEWKLNAQTALKVVKVHRTRSAIMDVNSIHMNYTIAWRALQERWPFLPPASNILSGETKADAVAELLASTYLNGLGDKDLSALVRKIRQSSLALPAVNSKRSQTLKAEDAITHYVNISNERQRLKNANDQLTRSLNDASLTSTKIRLATEAALSHALSGRKYALQDRTLEAPEHDTIMVINALVREIDRLAVLVEEFEFDTNLLHSTLASREAELVQQRRTDEIASAASCNKHTSALQLATATRTANLPEESMIELYTSNNKNDSPTPDVNKADSAVTVLLDELANSRTLIASLEDQLTQARVLTTQSAFTKSFWPSGFESVSITVGTTEETSQLWTFKNLRLETDFFERLTVGITIKGTSAELTLDSQTAHPWRTAEPTNTSKVPTKDVIFSPQPGSPYQGRNRELTELTPTQWKGLISLVQVMSAFAKHSSNHTDLANGVDIQSLSQPLYTLTQRLLNWPCVFRFEGVSSTLTDEHDSRLLKLKLHNASYGTAQLRSFDFVVGTVDFTEDAFGENPYLSLPIEHWFECDKERDSPLVKHSQPRMIELRFSQPDVIDIYAWNNLNVREQELVKALAFSIPSQIKSLLLTRKISARTASKWVRAIRPIIAAIRRHA